MPQVIYTDHSDEIVDLVDKVRNAADTEVALVMTAGTVGLQTPLNVRLLRQLGARAGKTVAIISGDPYIQELSRVGGLPTYASVPAFERGIQTVRAHADDGAGMAGAAGAGAVAAAATSVLAPPAPPVPPSRAPAAAPAPSRRTVALVGRRRPLYFVAAGLVVIVLLLLFLVAPSAKVTITLAGTPVSVTPTIQGSPAPGNAGQGDHIVTAVVSSDQSAQFTATPTGQKAVPAAPSTGMVVFHSKLLSGGSVAVFAGAEFDTATNPAVKFNATQAVNVTFPPSNGVTYVDGSPAVPIQAATAGVAGNVAAAAIRIINPDPCAPGNPQHCGTGDVTVSNPQATTGGSDATTQTIASATDVSGWTAMITQDEQTLTNSVNQDMQSKAAGKSFAKDPGGNGTTLACQVLPALPAANAVFAAAQITVGCHGKAAVYKTSDVLDDAKADLQAQVAQGDTLATDAINCAKPAVTQAADDGTVVLSVQCTSFSRPNIDLEALKGQITGKSPSDARNLIEHRLNHVKNVTVAQAPVPFFWLPFFAGRIEIVEAFVPQTGS